MLIESFSKQGNLLSYEIFDFIFLKTVSYNRCASFRNVKRGEICKVPGTTVSPAASGTASHLSSSRYEVI